MKDLNTAMRRSAGGFSVLELLVVVLIIGIMSTAALFYASAHKKLYEPDEQVMKLSDLLQEGRQRALTQRRTIRVEINLTKNTAYLYDENTNGTSSSDDQLVRSLPLLPVTRVRLDIRPFDISYNPPETMPVANALFKPSVYTPSAGQNVCTIRFLSNGTAVDAGTNAAGAGATMTGLTLHAWSPSQASTNRSDIARAVTVLGATGFVRLWEYHRTSPDANKWKDSRRSN